MFFIIFFETPRLRSKKNNNSIKFRKMLLKVTRARYRPNEIEAMGTPHPNVIRLMLGCNENEFAIEGSLESSGPDLYNKLK